MDYIIEIFNILSDLLFTQDNTQYQAVAPAVVIMGLQTAFSAGQAIKGGIDKRKAEEAQRQAIASYENKLRNIEIQNRLQALKVPTMGAELRERGIARATTAGIESMQEAGAEAVLGGVPRVVTAADAQSAQIAAELDRMEAIRDQEFLREEQRIEDERARREEQIAGVETMRATGAGLAAADAAGTQQAGLLGIASGLGGMAVQSAAAQNPYGTQPAATEVATTASSSPTASMGQMGMSGLARNQVFDPTVNLQGLNDPSMTFNQVGQYSPITQGISLTPTTPTSFQPSYFQSLMGQNASFDPTLSLKMQYQNPNLGVNTRLR